MGIRCISNSSFIGAQSFTRLLEVTIKGIFFKISDAFSLTRARSITLFQIRQDTSLAAAIFLFPFFLLFFSFSLLRIFALSLFFFHFGLFSFYVFRPFFPFSQQYNRLFHANDESEDNNVDYRGVYVEHLEVRQNVTEVDQ